MPSSVQWIVEAQSTAAFTKNHCRFVARQPIVNRMRQTVAYELLFRSGWENRFAADGESASRQMLDNAVSFGFASIVGNALPFVNCTRSLLLSRMPAVLPKNTVLEILEDCEVDLELVQACRELGMQGYSLALDDFDFSERWELLIPFVQYIKVDFRASTPRQRSDLAFRLKYHNLQLLAEKVETEEEFQQGMREGFHLFQGYYFMRPVVMAHKSLTGVVNRLRFLAELASPELDRRRTLRLVKEEPSISYRVLRLANSAALSVRQPVKSLDTALAIIGEDQFRRLAMLALATEISGGSSLDPVRSILQRARLCELLGGVLGKDPGEMYLLGMLSVVRSALQLGVGELRRGLGLPAEVCAALEGVENEYSHLLKLAESCEKGWWDRMETAAAVLRIPQEKVAVLSLESQRWAEEVLWSAGNAAPQARPQRASEAGLVSGTAACDNNEDR